MSDSGSWAAWTGVGAYIALRAVDYLLPPGRHWRVVERFSRRDTEDTEDTEDDDPKPD